ncbi:MAG TPA: hypothetical protein VKG85_08940 [Actinomycetes bacterium]|nr:hypothetical protein [Actinomycetes bacterium]
MGIFTLVTAGEPEAQPGASDEVAVRPEETVKALVTAALKQSRVRFKWLDPWTVDLVLRGRPLQADVTELVRSWSLAPETRRETVVERWVEATLAYPAWETRRGELAQRFDTAKDRLLIRLQPSGLADEEQALVRSYAAGIDAAVFLDVDRPATGLSRAPSSLQWTDLGRWSAEQIDDVEVLAQARANTRKVIEPWHVGVQELAGGSRVSLVVAESSHGASPALFVEDLLPAPAPNGVLVSVPQHDTTMIHLITDRQQTAEAVPWMVARTAQMFGQLPHPVSPDVYWWRDDSLSLLDVDRSSSEWQIMPDEEFRSMFAQLPPSDAEPAPARPADDGHGGDEGEYDDELLT